MLLVLYGCGLLAMFLAMGRDRNPAIWFVAGLFSGPLAPLALLILRRA